MGLGQSELLLKSDDNIRLEHGMMMSISVSENESFIR